MKNKLLLIGLLALVILSSSAMALTAPSGGVSYYNFSDTTDLWGSNDATNNGATSVTDYPTYNISGNSSPNSYSFDGSNDYVDTGFSSNDDDASYSLWYYSSGLSDNDRLLVKTGSGLFAGILYFEENIVWNVEYSEGNYMDLFTTFEANAWTHIVVTYSSGTYKIYKNGVEKDSSTSSNYIIGGYDLSN